MTPHPLRTARLRLFTEHGVPNSYRAVLGKDGHIPLYFAGSTIREAMTRAEAWRAEQLAKHEAAYLQRQERARLMRERRGRDRADTDHDTQEETE